MEASVFQLANNYFVFSGVILTAVIKGSSSSFKCHHFWLPFSLFLIGAILNFGTLLSIVLKYKETLDQLDDKRGYQTMYRQHRKKKVRRKAIMVLSTILFLIFTALNLVATRIILSQRASPYRPNMIQYFKAQN
ncbi:hypothetical protein CDL12_15860 [Handroanthus impetiginosus]|uniref:Uncharacterized protein n=1 Tax=Handroanthus impetiginosus TaxID=429701 RepID=A0A2G9H204_9LAMI|nr:hypothetical protein CDL12_15860 [Handroanthus impetiginosus]